ncbi:hypothetical protein N7466_003940 [Penicillium verhagenii]|uniref:uncharacterized protein n=1 Tax=Penicillium verhagenii TaxID=1562060 RepID=UPI00254580EF|nr:uncharacterized protein N7466_003940 [Penicillium verhagenii]KAJ5934393.1 hypothetical protein N7466_003940 [Penicillium verhagenii]
MPFCGRPSKACLSCRQRRIKCNRAVPVCAQCRRAGKQCTGYRDELPLLFRDENARTIRRSLKAKGAPEQRERATSAHLLTRPEYQIQRTPGLPLTQRYLAPHIDDQGLSFFFSHFTSSPAANGIQEPTKSHPFLRQVMENQLSRRTAVAIGLAAASNCGHGLVLLKTARQKYGESLQGLQIAVQSAAMNKDLDGILQVILMLALFEFIDCDASSITSWAIHADGAAAVMQRFKMSPAIEPLQMDPRKQLHFHFSMFVKYFFMGGPSSLNWTTWLRRNPSTFQAEDQPAVALLNILASLAQLYSSLMDASPIPLAKVAHIAIAIEAELVAWEEKLPEKWSYELKYSTDMPYTFKGLYHLYRDEWASCVLNNYRYVRLLVNDIILTYTTKPTVRASEELPLISQQALATITRIAAEICIAVRSQIFHKIHQPDINSVSPPPALNSVFMALFQLTLAAWGTGVPDELFEWVIDTLRMIGHTKGIQHALCLIEKLRNVREQQKLGRRPLLLHIFRNQ